MTEKDAEGEKKSYLLTDFTVSAIKINSKDTPKYIYRNEHDKMGLLRTI